MCESDSNDFKLNSTHTSQNKKKTKKMLGLQAQAQLVTQSQSVPVGSNALPIPTAGCVSDDCDASSVGNMSPLTLPM